MCSFLLCLVRLLPHCQLLASGSQILLFSNSYLSLLLPQKKKWPFILTVPLNFYDEIPLTLWDPKVWLLLQAPQWVATQFYLHLLLWREQGILCLADPLEFLLQTFCRINSEQRVELYSWKHAHRKRSHKHKTQPELIVFLGHHFVVWDSLRRKWRGPHPSPGPFPLVTLMSESCPGSYLPSLNSSRKLLTFVTCLRSRHPRDCRWNAAQACQVWHAMGPSWYGDFSHQTPAKEADWMAMFLPSPVSESMTCIVNIFIAPE